MKPLFKRLQTPLLVFLVLLSLTQFAIMISHSQEISRVVRQEVLEPPAESTFNTTHLVAPPRIYALLPNGDTALLRSSSAHYLTIWNTVLKGSLNQLRFLRPDLLQLVDEDTVLDEEVGIFLMLPSPLPLDQFCTALNIEFASFDHQVLPVINRIFVSAEKNDRVLIEDEASDNFYKLPITSKAEVFFNLLEITQNGVYYGLRPIDLAPYDFSAANEIYTYQQTPYVSSRSVGRAHEQNIEVIASRYFDDITMIRTFRGANDSLVYYDGIKTLRQLENVTRFPILELKRSADQSLIGDRPLQALVKELTKLQLWPQRAEYILDGLNCGKVTQGYYNLVNNGRPIFISQGDFQVTNTLKAANQDDSLTSLWLVEPVVGTSGKQHLAFSAEYILWSFWNQLEWVWPELKAEEIVLRDVYEGYLFSQDQKSVDLVWIIEFYNGAKVFYNMVNAEYLGRLAPLLDR